MDKRVEVQLDVGVLVDLSTAEDLATIGRMLTGRRGNPPLANVLA